MSFFRNLPIKRKMSVAVLGTTTIALLAACGTFLAYERVSFQDAMASNLTVLADALGRNSVAVLSFAKLQDTKADAEEILAALGADPAVIAACLYTDEGLLHATYVRDHGTAEFPPKPGKVGTRFEGDFMVVVRPVEKDGEQIGTIYLRTNLEGLHARLRLYAGISGLVLLGSFLLALGLSSTLQQLILQPILALTDATRRIAQRRDYSARAEKLSSDELGQLTDAFNQMLAVIQERDDALQRSNTLIEAIREAQTLFILGDSSRKIFDVLLNSLLKLADSEYGFIDELFRTPDGEPYLSPRATTDIARSEETRHLSTQSLNGERDFTNKKSLFGEVLTTGRVVIANGAAAEPRRDGGPGEHPALSAFLGIPLVSNQEFIGVIGLANRPGGYSEEFAAYLEPVVKACANLLTAWRIDQQRITAEEEIRQLNASLEQRVRERTAELELAVKELDAFSYSISHDLRAPLRAVDGYSRMLLEDFAPRLDDEGRRKVDVIRSETRRMGQLIDDLLAFSRLSRQKTEAEVIDMHALAQKVFDELAALDPDRRLRLDLHLLPLAYGTRAMIRQVWVNLISNAIKFTKERVLGEIEIDAREGDDGAPVYYVRDNGAGFDMRHVSKLFGVFQRLHGQQEFQGTGVGLALVQRIVQRHGGRVWAEGKVGHGATFYFTIPNQKP